MFVYELIEYTCSFKSKHERYLLRSLHVFDDVRYKGQVNETKTDKKQWEFLVWFELQNNLWLL